MDFRDKVAKEKDSYILLLGDLINNNTRSSCGSPYEDTIRPREQKKIMAEMLSPLRDKIIGIVSGNHERRSLKDADDDPTYDIACKLDLEDVYRENAAFIYLNIGERKYYRGDEIKQWSGATYNIAMTHGSGGGALTGSSVNRNERFGYTFENIDVLITAHTHKGSVTKPGKYVFNQQTGRMMFKPFVCVSVCSWLSYGGYGLQKMLNPATTATSEGGQVLRFSGDRHNKYIKTEW